ncbi:MAG: hypothetical protein ABL932_05980 [Terricaulis sp.]
MTRATHVSNNTARNLYLLVNTTEPERTKTPVATRRVSGVGLASAVLVSLMLWAGLFWLGVQIIAAITR